MADIDVDVNEAASEAVALAARRAALADGGARVNVASQAECPVDKGTLRRSHRVEGPDAEGREVHVLATAGHALPVHEGHRIVAWGRETGRYQPPNPWFRRGIDRASVGG